MNRRSQSGAKVDGGRAHQHKEPALTPVENGAGPVKPVSNPADGEAALYRHALERSREEFQAFAYSVSHDLRAPLRAIEGFSKILLEDFSKDLNPEAARLLAHIVTNTQVLGSQIEDLLKYYRAGKNPPSKRPVDSAEICKEALAAVQQLTEKKVKIVQKPLPSVPADPVQLREIFTQLLANALKFTSRTEEPVIEIDAHVEPGATTFFVRDNGAGFEARNSERLFQVFQKLHSPSEYPGNGIGLAVVKRLVEAHGGCVSASSEPGKGATFCFSLPHGNDIVLVAQGCEVAA